MSLLRQYRNIDRDTMIGIHLEILMKIHLIIHRDVMIVRIAHVGVGGLLEAVVE
jgi:hypothetical protein